VYRILLADMTTPGNYSTYNTDHAARHTGFMNVVFADGHAESVRPADYHPALSLGVGLTVAGRHWNDSE